MPRFHRDTLRTLCGLVVLAAAGRSVAAPGDLDQTFGGGVTQTDVAHGEDQPQAMAVASDGSFFVAGSATIGLNRQIAVMKYTATGALDTGFGGDGIVTTAIGNDAVAYAVAVQGDGKVVVAGSTNDGFDTDVAVVRYLANGDPDNDFGGDGIATFDLAGHTDEGHAVLIEAGGEVDVVGWSLDAGFKSVFLVLRFDDSGALDTNFGGGDGIVTADFTNGAEAYAAVRRDSDGAIIAAGRTTFFDDFALAVFTNAGVPDTSFSSDGFATTDFGNLDRAVSVFLQPTGEIVAVGETRSNSHDGQLAIARYEADGDPDMTFDDDGKRTGDLGNNATVRGGALLAGGRIAVLSQLSPTTLAVSAFTATGGQDPGFHDVGSAFFGLHALPAAIAISGGNGGAVIATELYAGGGGGDFGLLRLHGDGTIDRAFGAHGRVLVTFNPSAIADAPGLVVQSDGKIVIAGTNDQFHLLLGRFDASGALDATFGNEGGLDEQNTGCPEFDALLRLPGGGFAAAGTCAAGPFVAQYDSVAGVDGSFGSMGSGIFSSTLGGNGGFAHAMARQSDGKLVVVGSTGLGLAVDFFVMRLTEVGAADPDFGTGGVATVDFGGNVDVATGVVVQPDGRIVVAGWSSSDPAGADFAVARLLSGGTLDPDFGTGGKVVVDFGGVEDRAGGVLRESGGRLVVVGQAGASPNTTFALLGLDATGTPDAGFGTAGKVTSNLTGDDSGRAIVELSDGRLLVGGTVDDENDVPSFGLARYSADGVLETGFGTGGLVRTPFFGAQTSLSALALTPDGGVVASGSMRFRLSTAVIALARYELGGGATTTTTLPSAEICGNCIDDDGDGLTDFEDPSCCTGGPSLALARGRLKPSKTATKLNLAGSLAGTTPDVAATGVTVQLRPSDGGDLMCAHLAAAKFRRKGKTTRFVDKKGTLAGAAGLNQLLLKQRRDGSTVLTTAAKRAAFATPAAGSLTLTLGFGDGSSAAQCAGASATFRARKHGVIVAP